MPPTDDPIQKTVEQWREQYMAEHKFRQEQIEHKAFCASAMVIKGWTLETMITEAEYNAGIAESKAY